PAARPCPWHRHPLDPVIRAIDPRHPRHNEAVVLKEVQMLPGENGEVMRLARPAAFWTGEQGSAFGGHFEVQFMRPLLDIKPLIAKFPRLAQAKPEREHILRFHRRPPCRHPTSMQAAIAPFNSAPNSISNVEEAQIAR